jgi:hypothetical protein
MATPMVSGAAALVKAANPRLSGREIAAILMDTSDNINRLNPDYLGRLGTGRLNVSAAVNKALSQLKSRTAQIIYAGYSGPDTTVYVSDRDGNSKAIFQAYGDNFHGGVNLATGDVKEEKGFEIITGAGYGGGPHVRILNLEGIVLGQFFAYDENFRGGVNVAVGDINGDGQAEIITGAGKGGGPQVRVWNADGQVLGQFFAYDENFRGGVNVAVGLPGFDDNPNSPQILTGPQSGMPGIVRSFNNTGILKKEIMVFDKFQGGVNLSLLDMDQDGYDEIVVGAGPGGGPHVKIYKAGNKLYDSFYAFSPEMDSGVSVGYYFSQY